MKHLSRFLLLVVLLISVPAHARTGAAVHKEVLKAANHTANEVVAEGHRSACWERARLTEFRRMAS